MKVTVLDINGKEYAFIKKVKFNNCEYCYFTNINDQYDLCIRKLIKGNNDYELIGLDDEKELYMAIEHFEDK